MSAEPFFYDEPSVVFSQSLRDLSRHLQLGGIGIIRSDTVPAAVCRAFSVDTVRSLERLLDHANEPFSVNFFSAEVAEGWLEPSAADLRILDRHAPGRITLVSRVKPHAIPRRLSQALNAGGETLGIRVSSSIEEAHLAKLMDGPVVTAAIKIAGSPASNVEEAAEFFRERLRELNIGQRVMALRDHAGATNTDLSTVVRTRKEGRWSVSEILREGAVSRLSLQDAVTTPWSAREIEDVT